MQRLAAPWAAMAVLAAFLPLMVVGVPILAVAGVVELAGGNDGDTCTAGDLAPLSDGTPGILGPATLTHVELTSWWDTRDKGQPPRLTAPIDDVIRAYLHEGDTEGVRGDVALAQAVHETGWFTNSDTAHNNYAGIAHYDGTSNGRAFPDPTTGVRAHIQLLKKFAEGNDIGFAHPDVAPDAGAQARSWGELAGTWATDPNYWQAINQLYTSMLDHAGREPTSAPPADPDECSAPPRPGTQTPDGTLTEVRGIIVATAIAPQLDELLAAAEADGVHLTGSGYRSYDRQVELRRAHCGTTHHAIYDMPADQCSPPTARPGSSMHELGLAIDFENCASHTTQCWQWLNTNAATYGFFNLLSEPWHWSVDGT